MHSRIKNLPSLVLFFTGLLLMPAFFLQDDFRIRWCQAVLFISLAVTTGTNFRVLPNLIMTGGVVIFNLMSPLGRVLFQWEFITITKDALISGLDKGALLVGVIYLSRFSVHKNLTLPGKAGNLFSEIFFCFDRITQGERITRKNIISQLDNKLQAIEDDLKNAESLSSEKGLWHTGAASVLFIFVTMNWLFLFL